MSAPKKPTTFVPTPGFDPIHREDVAAFFQCSSDKFGQLAALFNAIAGKLNELDQAHALAKLGYSVAQDFENMTDCWRENAEKGGVSNV